MLYYEQTKFDVKAEKCVFLGYSERSKTYRVNNSETKLVEESLHVRFDDKNPESKMLELVESCAKIQVSEDASELTRLNLSYKLQNKPIRLRY